MNLPLRYLRHPLPVRAEWSADRWTLHVEDVFTNLPPAARRMALGEEHARIHAEFTHCVLGLLPYLAVPAAQEWFEPVSLRILTQEEEARSRVQWMEQGSKGRAPQPEGVPFDEKLEFWSDLPYLEQLALSKAIYEVFEELQREAPTKEPWDILNKLPHHPKLLPFWRSLAAAPLPFPNYLRLLAEDYLSGWHQGPPRARHYGYPGYAPTAEDLIERGTPAENILYSSVREAFNRNYPREYVHHADRPVGEGEYFQIVRQQLHPRYVPTSADWTFLYELILGEAPLAATVAIHFVSYTYRPAPWLLYQDVDGATHRRSLHAQPPVDLPPDVIARIVEYADGRRGQFEHCGPIAEQCLANLAQVELAQEAYVDFLLERAGRSEEGPAGPVIAVALASTYLYGYRREDIYAYLLKHVERDWPFSYREFYGQVAWWFEEEKYRELWELKPAIFPREEEIPFYGLADRRSRLFAVGGEPRWWRGWAT